MRSTKGTESILCRIVFVGVSIIDRSAEARDNQESLEVPLEEYVKVNPLADVAAGSHVPRSRVKKIGRLTNTSLHSQPRRKIRHVILAAVGEGSHGSDLLIQIVDRKSTR